MLVATVTNSSRKGKFLPTISRLLLHDAGSPPEKRPASGTEGYRQPCGVSHEGTGVPGWDGIWAAHRARYQPRYVARPEN